MASRDTYSGAGCLSSILFFAGAIVLAISVLAIVLTFAIAELQQDRVARYLVLCLGIGGFPVALFLFATGEIIRAIIDTARNTASTADLLAQMTKKTRDK